MAYSIPWDEADPPGATTPADTIDTELQELKVSIRERIEDVIPDWSNDAVDPKTISTTTSSYSVYNADTGVEASNSVDKEVLFLLVTGTTDASGNLQIDFTNLTGSLTNTDWSLFGSFVVDKNVVIDSSVNLGSNITGYVVRNRIDGSALPSFLVGGAQLILLKTT